ncbi:MAG: response regulator, partial [Fibrobacteres bacterium]|nr:response regulator [Fibrobacterota bacterium]
MSSTSAKLRVLCADDEPAILDLFKDFLETSGCLVTVASNGSEAYQANRQWQHDMVILDVNMPVMNGHEAIMAIRERNTKAYILLISGTADHSELASALDKGADAIMKKPFTLSELSEHLAAADSKRSGKPLKLSSSAKPNAVPKSWYRKLIDKMIGSQDVAEVSSKKI